MATDKDGSEVKVGDTVQLLIIDPTIFKTLSINEINDIKSMKGELFQIEEIDEYQSAWVTKWFNRGEGNMESHSLGLSSLEMKLISK